jgi:hypothetical protein
MVKARKMGIILFLMGICLLLISFAFVSRYDKKLGLLGSVSKMEIVLKEGTWLAYPPGYIPPKPAEAPRPPPRTPEEYKQYKEQDREFERIYLDPLKKFIPHYEGRIAIAFKYFFAIDMIIIFLGITAMILSKTNPKEVT